MSNSFILAIAFLAVAASLNAADGKQVVYIGGYGPTLTCFSFDGASGNLTKLSESDGGNNPSYLAWDPTKHFMYALNEGDPGKLVSFSIDAKDGKLTKLNEVPVAVGGACHIACHPSGKWVVAANYGSGHIVVAPIKADGSLGPVLPSMPPGKHAHQAVFDPTGDFLFVPFLGDDHIDQFRFDVATGALTPNTPPFVATAEKAGPRHLALAPDGATAYGINELDCTLNSYAYDKAKGALTLLASVSTLPADFDRKKVHNSTAHVMVSPDGRFVYGSNRGHNSIVIYRTGPAGKLDLVGYETGGGEIKIPRDFGMTPDGSWLLVANQDGGSVTVFKVDHTAGTLTKTSTATVPGKPAFVGIVTLP